MQQNTLIQHPANVIALVLSMSGVGILTLLPAHADTHANTPGNLHYESALTGYRSLDGNEPVTWQKSNEKVGEIGGWRTYAYEAYQANKAEAMPAETGNAAEKNDDVLVESEAASTPADAKLQPQALAMDTPTQGDDGSMKRKSANSARSAPRLSLTYQSALSDYRPYDDNPPGGWRAANDRVGEIGGWRTYAKQAYEASKNKATSERVSGVSE